MRVPHVSLDVDGRVLTGPEAAMIAVQVCIGAGTAVDAAEVVLGRQSPVAGSAPGTAVEIALGFDGATDTVLTGEVAQVAQRPWGLVLEVLALPARLQRLRLGRSYLDLAPADIIADLAAEAEVETGQLVGTATLAAYHVEERRNAWRHVQDLARLAGGEISSTPDGKLTMSAVGSGGGLGGALGAAASAAGSLIGLGGDWRFGAELLDATIASTRPDTAPAVVAYGAASPAGADKWHLLLKEPDGGAPSGPTLVPAAIRDQDGADGFADGLTAVGARRGTTATLVVVGRPELRSGDEVSIADWPLGDPPTLRIVSVEHDVGRETGFTSRVRLEQAA